MTSERWEAAAASCQLGDSPLTEPVLCGSSFSAWHSGEVRRRRAVAFGVLPRDIPPPTMDAQPLPIELTLRAIARLEAAGVRDPRLTDPDLVAWKRFRRKLGFGAFIELLHEDLAGSFPVPFDLERWHENPVRALSDDHARDLVLAAARAAHEPPESPVFLRDCARSLGLPAGGAFSDLPKIQSQHHALELPGSGGRIAAALHGPNPSPSFHAHFTFVADSDAERIAIGLAAVEVRANEPRIVTTDALVALLERGEVFDRVVGFRESPRAVELAARYFPEAKLV